MRIKQVQFINTVSFGGQLQSASIHAVGDRPGQGGMEIEMDEKMRFISLTKLLNGNPSTRLVPMTNVAAFEPLEVRLPMNSAVNPVAVKK